MLCIYIISTIVIAEHAVKFRHSDTLGAHASLVLKLTAT